jgi:surface protein
MFNGCTSLTTVPLFDTSRVRIMGFMFNNCTNLTVIPLFDITNVTYMTYTFRNCINVQSGALAIYKRASTKAIEVTTHNETFTNCGSNTTTGAAELAQIPSDWK